MTAQSPFTRAKDGQAAHNADIIIIGAGFAGALAALLLGRAGHSVLVVDPHPTCPDGFRCEKFSHEQLSELAALGVLSCLPGAEALTTHGLRYDRMVNGLRDAWPQNVHLVTGKATRIVTENNPPQVHLQGGQVLAGRLVVLATGSGERLRRQLGLRRYMLSENHSVCIGLTLRTGDGSPFATSGFIHHGERAGDGVGYASLFPLEGDAPDRLRLNLFLYDAIDSARIRAFRTAPLAALLAALPHLAARLPGNISAGTAEIHVNHLYDVSPPARPGLVLIGDARRTSCPATGSGITRIIRDARDLALSHAANWLSDGPAPERLAAFYEDEARRALDAELFRRSVRGRALALGAGPWWRLQRALRTLRPRWKPKPVSESPAINAAPRFVAGDRVRIRSAVEILSTLDRDGCLDGLPFMPEMAAHIGHELTVRRRAGRTCIEGEGFRRLDGAVFLEDARCDGVAHDGCQRGCLIFWKEAWLQPGSVPPAPVNPPAEKKARLKLMHFATRRDRQYLCQSTALKTATQGLSRLHPGALLTELRDGEMPLRAFLRLVARALVNRLRHAFGLADLDQISGETGRKSRGSLGLQPGDWVRVRDAEAIRATLDPTGRNLGLSFEPEMTLAIGQVRQVDQVINRIVHEVSGEMVSLSHTVTLKGLVCEGLCSKACPRANPLFWREAWLERVAAPPTLFI